MSGLRITAPYFCAGTVYEAGTIIRAAPILKYMIGWSVMRAVKYCQSKGWHYEVL